MIDTQTQRKCLRCYLFLILSEKWPKTSTSYDKKMGHSFVTRYCKLTRSEIEICMCPTKTVIQGLCWKELRWMKISRPIVLSSALVRNQESSPFPCITLQFIIQSTILVHFHPVYSFLTVSCCYQRRQIKKKAV